MQFEGNYVTDSNSIRNRKSRGVPCNMTCNMPSQFKVSPSCLYVNVGMSTFCLGLDFRWVSCTAGGSM